MDDNQVKFAFVKEVLEKHGKKIVAAIGEGIRFNQYQGTGYMETSAGFTVDQSNNSDGALHITAPDYLRFQDILASHKKARRHETSTTLSFRGAKARKHESTKGGRKGFYTKSIYRQLSPIIWDLSFGFTEEVKQDIRERFKEYVVS